MNPIDEQRALIEDLYQLVKNSAKPGFEAAYCRFRYRYFDDDGSCSIQARFSYDINGTNVSDVLNYPEDRRLDTVIPKLHSLMKAHTGGDWEAFTLTIGKDGRVTTKFEYPGLK